MGLRPDLNGLRFRKPGDDAVFVIDQGQKRWITDPWTYGGLFRDWNNIHLDIDIDEIDDGPHMGPGTVMFQCQDSPKVFLRDGAQKRWIREPAVMDRFQFSWSAIHHWNVNLGDIGLPDGPDLVATGRPD